MRRRFVIGIAFVMFAAGCVQSGESGTDTGSKQDSREEADLAGLDLPQDHTAIDSRADTLAPLDGHGEDSSPDSLPSDSVQDDTQSDADDADTSPLPDGGEIVVPHQCDNDSECPKSSSVCAAPDCEAGYCTFVQVPAGEMAPVDDEPGDCMWPKCTGYAVPTYEFWDSDTPKPLGPCMEWKCNQGQEIAVNVELGVPCEDGTKICNGWGVCAECLGPDDCPNTAGACAYPICDNGVCSLGFESNGLSINTNSPNDCVKHTCDGAGNVLTSNDDSEIPTDDANECTKDYCSQGTAVYEPVPAGSPCVQPLATMCNGLGDCVACVADSDCGPPAPCFTPRCSQQFKCYNDTAPNGTELEDGISGNCKTLICDNGLPYPVEDPLDPPAPTQECMVGSCNGETPVQFPVQAGTPCGDGKVCNADGQCV